MVITVQEFVVCLVILLAAQRRLSSFMWPAGETTKMGNTKERNFTQSSASLLSFWLILFPTRGKQSQNLECIVSRAVSAGDAGLGGVSQKLEEQMLLEEPRGSARPADTLWCCPMSTSHREVCFLPNSLVSPQRSSDVRKGSWEQCLFH